MDLSKPSMNPVLRSFWTANARNYVLYGGRASSKSWDAAAFVVFAAINFKMRIVCARQFQNKISESVYTLIKTQAERFGVAHLFKFEKASITVPHTGSEFLFFGIARNLDEIKSLEDVDVLWLEEAQNLVEEQWRTLEPTIRKEGSKVFIVFNPQFATDFVYRHFVVNPPPDTITRLINFDENPFLSKTMRAIIEAHKERDPEDFKHTYLGIPRADEDRVLIKRAWLEACIDAHIKLGFSPAGERVLGFDVADDGGDKNANVIRHGSVVIFADDWMAGEDELTLSVKRSYNNARQEGARMIYDSIGVGAFVGGKVTELNESLNGRMAFSGFNAGGAVPYKEDVYREDGDVIILRGDYFSNAKAVAWWDFAARVRNTYECLKGNGEFTEDELVSFSSDIPDLKRLLDELAAPKRDFDRNGRVKVEDKDSMADRGVKSPNLADACVMAFYDGDRRKNGFFS